MHRLRTSLQRTTLLLVLAVAFASPAAAQHVPATARASAASPKYAARLSHSATPRRRVSPGHGGRMCNPILPVAGSPQFLPADELYSNGPINGTEDAWTINFGFSVADSFTFQSGGYNFNGLSFGVWLFPGDTLQNAELLITSEPFGGTTFFDSVVNFTISGCVSNQYGFNVCIATGSFNGPTLDSGTFWITLQNAVVNTGDPAYWDENSGPSQAAQNSIGSIPSEAFTLLGSANTTSTTWPDNVCMPEQYGAFQVIHDFTNHGDGDSPVGVTLDKAGNVYGPTRYPPESGSVYKLAQAGWGWVLSTLYNFTGGSSGNSPSGVIAGQNGVLYGAAVGGISNCYGGYCGFIFNLRPTPTTCLTSSCGWTEKPVYSFTGQTDASQGGRLVSDSAGNLYGVSASGGAHFAGAVFQLSPMIGGWEETLLYEFPGESGGAGPTDIIVGNDGNLYGTVEWGGAYGYGYVFQLAPAAGAWQKTVLYDFPAQSNQGSNPHALMQDSSGSLYGTYEYTPCCANTFGLIYMLTPSNQGWIFSELHRGDENLNGDDVFPDMVMDSRGNIWGTGTAYTGCMNSVSYGYIFELSRSDGWMYSTPVFWDYTYFPTTGSLGLDARGNLYGTTSFCGTQDFGTVWQFGTQQ
jgi:uncharacterized repeat protein (TIGR03803 family)